MRISRATFQIEDFEPKAIDLIKRMLNQGGDQNCVERYLLKIIRRHPESFTHFMTDPLEMVQKLFSQMV